MDKTIFKKYERPVWFIFIEDVSSKTIKPYNIFNCDVFYYSCADAFETFFNEAESSHIPTRLHAYGNFKKAIRDRLAFYFWHKSEWELNLVSGNDVPPKKIDPYYQVINNFDAFFDNYWNWLEYTCGYDISYKGVV